MLKLSRTDTTPPGGWHCLGDCGLYEQEPVMIRGGTLNDVIIAVMNYRIANRLPVEDVRNEVEEWICRNTQAKCRTPAPTMDGSTRKLTVADVWRFLRTMKEWMKDGTLVTPEEADRRAEICAGCRFNVDLSDGSCWGCGGVADIVHSLIGNRQTRLENHLKNCQVCGCFNKVSAWVPLDVLKASSGNLDYPEDTGGRDLSGAAIPCWKR